MSVGEALHAGLLFAQEILRIDRPRHEAYIQGDRNLKRSLPSMRRIDIISIAGGCGCSSLAARLAVLLTHRRGGRVLGVDAGREGVFSTLVGARDHGPDDIAEPWQPPAQTTRRLHAPISLRHLDEVASGLRVGFEGLRVLRPASPFISVRPEDWATVVTPLAPRFDVMVTDWGHRRVGVDFEKALTGSDIATVVCRADRFAIEAALGVAEAISALTPCVVCAVDVDDIGPDAARIAKTWSKTPLFQIPFMATPISTAPPLAVRRALIDVGAHLMGEPT